MDEIFDIVDEHNNIIGCATRKKCHGNPSLIHRIVHVIIVNSDKKILLQKRTLNKDIQPGKWDTAVGGHLNRNESFEDAAIRETEEELGIKISPDSIKFLFDMKIRNKIESENVKVFLAAHNGPFNYNKGEIEELKFWSKENLLQELDKNNLTPSCKMELQKFFHLFNFI